MTARKQVAHDRRATDPKSPALAPLPVLPVERLYEVVGPRPVLGHDPGETFRTTLSFEQEAQLVEGGHIKRAAAKPGQEKE